MESYAITVRYAPEYRSSLAQNPANHLKIVEPLVEELGGKIKSLWLTIGPLDVLLLAEFPTEIAASALVSIVQSGGMTSQVELISLIETNRWLQKAVKIGARYFNLLWDIESK